MSDKGSIGFRRTKSGGYYFVRWYIGNKDYKISRYKGFLLETPKMANSLLSLMRDDDENGCFRIEKYLFQETDTVAYLDAWVKDLSGISPMHFRHYYNKYR